MSKFNIKDLPVLREPTRETWVEECEWTGQKRHRDRYGGVWRRYAAAIASLTSRACFGLCIYDVSKPEAVSQYGDTDQTIAVEMGSRWEDFTDSIIRGRVARAVGELTLHRTVGGNTVWSFSGVVAVRSTETPEVVTVFEVQYPDTRSLCRRAVDEIAARSAERAALEIYEKVSS